MLRSIGVPNGGHGRFCLCEPKAKQSPLRLLRPAWPRNDSLGGDMRSLTVALFVSLFGIAFAAFAGDYSCSATCKIEYRNPYDVAYQTVEAKIYDVSSSREAVSKADGTLRQYCQEHCTFSRDAFSCRLSTPIQCF